MIFISSISSQLAKKLLHVTEKKYCIHVRVCCITFLKLVQLFSHWVASVVHYRTLTVEIHLHFTCTIFIDPGIGSGNNSTRHSK